MKLPVLPVILLAFAASMASMAQAGVTTTGTVYGNTAGSLASTSQTLMTDQSGLSAGYTSGVTDFATYIAGNPTHVTGAGGATWLSNGVPTFPFELDFDLGSTQTIQSLVIWNGTGAANAAINAFSVSTANVADFSVSTPAGSFNNVPASELEEPATVFDLTDTSARYLRLTVNSYFGNFCCTGIGEVLFETTAVVAPPLNPVPVVGTLPLTGLSLFALAAAARRRRT